MGEVAPNALGKRQLSSTTERAIVLVLLTGQFLWLFFTIFLLFASNITAAFVIAYVAWIYQDPTPYRGGMKKDWVRRLKMFDVMRKYFDAELIKTVDLDPSKRYIFGAHPHGVISVSVFLTFLTETTGWSDKFPGVDANLLTLDTVNRVPFSREWLGSCGTADVSKKSIDYILTDQSRPRSVAIVIGGAQEALDAIPGTLSLTLAKRKGFVRMALKHGASLVPVLSFGENDLFDQAQHPVLRKIQDFLQKRMGFSLPVIMGEGLAWSNYGLVPHKTKLVTVGRLDGFLTKDVNHKVLGKLLEPRMR